MIAHDSQVLESSAAQCRICHSPEVSSVGEVEFLVGYNCPIWDCAACGCRFTAHEHATYDELHSEPGSFYGRYRELAATCKPVFDNKDLEGLRAELSRVAKYKFIIDELAALDRNAQILEIGCARGFLTSYFILGGWRILGIDASLDALRGATELFGVYFAPERSPEIKARAPYDAIYHAGTIGCVADPIGMTEELHDLLKPGGRLLFNAPNRDACSQSDQLWFGSAPPPDLVTLFAPGFWSKHFARSADVFESVETVDSDMSFKMFLRRLFRKRWRHPTPTSLETSGQASRIPAPTAESLWNVFERLATKLGRLTGLSRLVSEHPSEYGLFVTMQRRLK